MTTNAIIGLCTVHLHLPEAAHLKAKRAILKSMLAKLHNKFNISAAEIAENDRWQSAVIAFAVVTNSSQHAQQSLQTALDWLEVQFPEALIVKHTIELI